MFDQPPWSLTSSRLHREGRHLSNNSGTLIVYNTSQLTIPLSFEAEKEPPQLGVAYVRSQSCPARTASWTETISHVINFCCGSIYWVPAALFPAESSLVSSISSPCELIDHLFIASIQETPRHGHPSAPGIRLYRANAERIISPTQST